MHGLNNTDKLDHIKNYIQNFEGTLCIFSLQKYEIKGIQIQKLYNSLRPYFKNWIEDAKIRYNIDKNKESSKRGI